MRRVLTALCVGAVIVTAPGLPSVHTAGPFDLGLALEKVSETTANACIGDVNGDGFPDIVLAKGRHWPLPELVLLNDGHGRFSERYDVSDRADRSYTAALADLDGNGTLDLVVGNDTPDPKVIYFNDGRGHFTFAGTFGDPHWPTRNVTVVDLNGDHRPDIVVANRGGPGDRAANYVCMNDGHGHFPSCVLLSHESASTIAAGDLNQDGAVDLVVPSRDGGQSYVFFNDGHGRFGSGRPFGPPNAATRAVAVGDLDGDGRPDIVIGDERRGGAFIYFNRGSSFSEPLRIGEKSDVPYSIALADLDADGHLDIVLGNERARGAVLINDGTGLHYQLVRFGDSEGSVYGLAVGDIDGDGRPDIVAARSGAPSMLYLNALVPHGRSAKDARASIPIRPR